MGDAAGGGGRNGPYDVIEEGMATLPILTIKALDDARLDLVQVAIVGKADGAKDIDDGEGENFIDSVEPLICGQDVIEGLG